jgi:predicted RNase H-like HicB family nuclease
MTYYVLVENGKQGNYTATVLGWPDCTAQGATRQEALARIRQALITRLAQVEIVPLEIEHPHPGHPWLKFAGVFKDNPLFDDVLAEIEAHRHELDADDTVI